MSYFDKNVLNETRERFLKELDTFKNDTMDFNSARKVTLILFDTNIQILEALVRHKKLIGMFITDSNPDTFYYNIFTSIDIKDLEIEIEELKELLLELTTKNAEWEEKVKDSNLN